MKWVLIVTALLVLLSVTAAINLTSGDRFDRSHDSQWASRLRSAVESAAVALDGFEGSDPKISDAARRLLRPFAIRVINLEDESDELRFVVSIVSAPSIRDLYSSHPRTMPGDNYNQNHVKSEGQWSTRTGDRGFTLAEDVYRHNDADNLVYTLLLTHDGSTFVSPSDVHPNFDAVPCLTIQIWAMSHDENDIDEVRPTVQRLLDQCGDVIESFLK